MWPNNNFGNNGIPDRNGTRDGNLQNSNYQDSYQENYNENCNHISFPSLAAGFPVYPFFPYEYYQPQNFNPPDSYMPNLFQQHPGAANNGFLQTTYTSPINNEQVSSRQPVASIQPGNNPTLTTRAEELKAQLMKSMQERTKPKMSPDPKTTSALTSEPTQQEMASLLRGSSPPTSDMPMKSSTDLANCPISVESTIDDLIGENGRAEAIHNKELVNELATELKTREDEIPKLIVDGRAAAEAKNNETLGIEGDLAKKSQSPSKAAANVHNDAESKKSKSTPDDAHATSLTSQAKVANDIQQNTASPIGTQYKKPTEAKDSQQSIASPLAARHKKRTEANDSRKNAASPRGSQYKKRAEEKNSQLAQETASQTTASRVGEPQLMNFTGSPITPTNKPNSITQAYNKHKPEQKVTRDANTNEKSSDGITSKGNFKVRDSMDVTTDAGGTPQVPTQTKDQALEKLLTDNEDLRDWLRLTKWDNVSHRTSTLNRYRAIMALDKQKARLLEGVAKIAALDEEKAKIIADMEKEQSMLGERSIDDLMTAFATPGNNGPELDTIVAGEKRTAVPDFLASLDRTKKSATTAPSKRSYSSFATVDREPSPRNRPPTPPAPANRDPRGHARNPAHYEPNPSNRRDPSQYPDERIARQRTNEFETGEVVVPHTGGQKAYLTGPPPPPGMNRGYKGDNYRYFRDNRWKDSRWGSDRSRW